MFALYTVKSPRNVYSYVKHALEDGNTINYLTASSTATLTSEISKDWSGVSRYINSRQLSIRSVYDYFPTDAGSKPAALKADAVSSKLLRSRNSIVILCPTAVSECVELIFHRSPAHSEENSSEVDRIKELETSISQQFQDSIVVCCLFDRFVSRLEIVPLLYLMKHHELAIRSDGKIIPLSDEDILGAMRRGMDAALGNDCSTLIFKTIRHIYNINENTLLLRPELWSDKLKKFLGEQNSTMIEKAVTIEIRKLVMQEH